MGAEQNETFQQQLPTMVGKYRLVAELGTGGMAHVYLAVMKGPHGFNKLVVLKVPRDTVAADPKLLAMFHEEARLAARLNHPNVVQTYEVIHEEGRDITVMEYLDGQPLHKVLTRGRKTGKPMPLAMHLRIISDALTGLHYAHEAKDYDGKALELVHRDISPPNLFVTFDGAVKVLDFGIAKASTSLHETQIGTFKGRIRYMPPEQLMGAKVDRRTDIFALGAILWDAAVGENMWKGRSDVEVISAVVGDEVPSPKSIRADVPDELDAIVRRAMAHDPRARHTNCIELQNELEAYMAKLPDRYSGRDLSIYMAELFTEIREERQRIIESQLAKARSLPTGEYAPLGQMDLPRASMGGSTLNSQLLTSGTTPSGARSLESMTSGSLPTSKLTIDTGNLIMAEKPRSRTVTALAVVGVIAILGGAVALGKSLKSDGSGESAKSSAPPVVASEAPQEGSANAAEPQSNQGVAVTVLRAEPSDARLYLDDTPLATNPSIQRAAKDMSQHVFRAEAKGYAPKSTTFRLTGDGELVLRLEKESGSNYPQKAWRAPARTSKETPAASSAAAAASPAAPASNPPTQTDSDKPKKSARPIDTNDPWAKDRP